MYNRAGLFFWLLFLFLYVSCPAQLSISGKVVNGETGLAVAGASIYFNNTSIGTISNSNGDFAFKDVAQVNTELIVSSVGYEILVLKLNTARANGKYFLCQLSVKEQQLKNVLIVSDERRRLMLNTFKENFLGLSQEADRSKVLNLEDIYFTMGGNKSTFKAYADTPLLIINNMLGYKVYFQLVEFSFDDSTGRTYFYGYTRYEDLSDKKRWVQNRKDAYYGSTLHFYRSLIKDELDDQGYDMAVFRDIRKDSVHPLIMAVPVTRSQILNEDSANTAYFRISAPGQLMVHYRRDPASKHYLQKRIFVQGNMRIGFRAFLTLRYPYFLVDRNGILENPLAVENGGYWIYERQANQLPFDYQP